MPATVVILPTMRREDDVTGVHCRRSGRSAVGTGRRGRPRPAARRAAGPATGSRPPLRRERSRSACVANAVYDTPTKTPPGTPSRVSYPVSDSMSCIRRAKAHGTETRADTPAEVGPVFFFRHVEADLQHIRARHRCASNSRRVSSLAILGQVSLRPHDSRGQFSGRAVLCPVVLWHRS